MLCHRPEQWDALDPRALAYLKRRGLMPVYDYIVYTMTDTWEFIDYIGIDVSDASYEDQSHPKHCSYELAYARAHFAFGAYNALLAATEKNDEIHKAIYDWGHYSVFY